tara:strand:+ start:594 stop:1544 length:951 start_codon:yes stop_codon:yes gene_type:complete
LSVIIASLIISLIITGYLIPSFKKYNLDIPNARSSHNIEKPTSGGLIFASIGLLFSIASSNIMILLSYPLAVLGFIDDKKNISKKIRYFGQFLVTSTILTYVYLSDSSYFFNNLFNQSLYIKLVLFPTFIVLGTAIINFVNFMDGIDGLVASCMAIFLILISLKINQSYLGLLGALLGFIFWNWNPSKIFMGDAGSTFLGSIYYGAILCSTSFIEFLLALNILAPLFLDTFSCLIRRFIAGQNIFSAHNLHLYQRLVKGGLSHGSVSIIYISATLLSSIGYLYKNISLGCLTFSLVISLGLWLENNKSLSFDEGLK